MATKKSTSSKRAKDVTIITATEKGETTMTKNANANTTAQEVITVMLNANTEREGLEIRFSGYPKAVVKNELVALKFRYYPALGNAWIKKRAKVSDDALKGFLKNCIKQGYEVKCTTDGKPDTWVSKYITTAKPVEKKPEPKAKETAPKVEEPMANNNDAVLKAMIELIKASGYTVTKAEAPAPEAPKAETKTEEKPKATRKPRTKKTETPKAKAETPEKESKPKAEEPKKLTATSIPVSNNPKKTKAEKKLFVDGKEIARIF